MARAASRTFASSTENPQQFQLFQPMGGVRAICGPIFSNISRSAFPRAFSAVSSTLKSPSAGTRPVIRPVRGSSSSPSGSPCAPYAIGRLPLAMTGIRKGLPGRAPYTSGLLICGVSGLAGVRIYLPLEIGLAQTDRGSTSPRVVIFTSSQSAWSYMIPSPASSTSSRTLSRPDKSTSNARAASPLRITPLSHSTFRSPRILNRCFPANRFLSSAPTAPAMETASPPSPNSIRLIEWVPTPRP